MSDGSFGRPTKNWRARLGLQQPAPDPDDWVSVISARVNDAEAGFSRTAARAAQVLTDSSIETEQRPYTLPDNTGFQRLPGAIPSPLDRVRVAVSSAAATWSAPRRCYARTSDSPTTPNPNQSATTSLLGSAKRRVSWLTSRASSRRVVIARMRSAPHVPVHHAKRCEDSSARAHGAAPTKPPTFAGRSFAAAAATRRGGS